MLFFTLKSISKRARLPAITLCVVQHVSCNTYLEDNSWLFQKISSHVGTDDVKVAIEANLDIFSKAAAVVISCRFGISNGLVKKMKWRRGFGIVYCLTKASQKYTNTFVFLFMLILQFRTSPFVFDTGHSYSKQYLSVRIQTKQIAWCCFCLHKLMCLTWTNLKY